MPFPCHWSDHSFRMLGSGRLARRLYVFWYHSFLIRTGISFQTSCKLPLAATLPFCFILIDLAVLHIVDGVSWRLLLLIFGVRAHFGCLVSFSLCRIMRFLTLKFRLKLLCAFSIFHLPFDFDRPVLCRQTAEGFPQHSCCEKGIQEQA